MLPVPTEAPHDDFLAAHRVTGIEVTRAEETWSWEHEELLRLWAVEWRERRDIHDTSRRSWRRCQFLLGVPCTVLPLVVAGIWGNLPPDEGNVLATSTMVLSGCLSGVLNHLKPDTEAEKHTHASYRYSDMLSDVEELLSKERRYRADVDITVQMYKMRSDTLLRVSPEIDYDEDNGLCPPINEDEEVELISGEGS